MMNEWRRWDDSTRLGSRFSVLGYIESKSRSLRHVPFVRFDAEDFLNFLSFFSFFFLSASSVSSALFDLGFTQKLLVLLFPTGTNFRTC